MADPAGVLAERSWGVIRRIDGEAARLGPKWKGGDGRWIRDTLVWTIAPSLFRNERAEVDRLR
jgi:hypothetical protein